MVGTTRDMQLGLAGRTGVVKLSIGDSSLTLWPFDRKRVCFVL